VEATASQNLWNQISLVELAESYAGGLKGKINIHPWF
jgi:hypothetical protein